MRLSIVSFTKAGILLSERIKNRAGGEISDNLKKEPGEDISIKLYTKCTAYKEDTRSPEVSYIEMPVGEWAGIQMKERNALLFIGACGIAVRAVAPFLTDKLQDVPVLVMDETGKYVIPLLSGHMGGANELAQILAAKTGAKPVITTATDLNGKFAIDIFAKKNGLSVKDKSGIAKISAKVLANEEITMSIETGHGNNLPERSGIRIVPYPPSGYVDLVITSGKKVFDTAMVLYPREYILGIGCKKGKSAEEIGQFITQKLREKDILITQIFALASISQKKEEEGLLKWCTKENIPFVTYTARELRETKGSFTESAFVKKQVGVDNVCERAALHACGAGGKLIVQKCAENGMTIAIAKRDWSLSME